MADAGPLGLLGPVRAFRQHRSLEPAHPLDGHSGRVCDLLRRLSGSDPVLDLLGSQGTLHFDLVLSEPRELPSRHDPQPVIDRQREAPAAPRCCQDGIAAILTHRDQAQFLHRRPFCAADRVPACLMPREGVARTSPQGECDGSIPLLASTHAACPADQ